MSGRGFVPEDDFPVRGRGHGRGRGQGRRGRPPVFYPVNNNREINVGKGTVVLSSFELQILQLSDLENLNQNEIAEKLNVSQTSVWRYLSATRKKIAEVISQHHEIIIQIRD
ncbi:MAG: DUF134 domain-containing protein [Candidatus Heimdallarchaeaceae archaeon]